MQEAAIKDADQAFGQQVTNQIARITGELNRLEQLLSAGMVDRRVLAEFRDSVNRVRQTSWHVQCWLEGDARNLSSLLVEERVRAATQMVNRLGWDLQSSNEKLSGLTSLRDAVQKLDRALHEKINS